MSANIKASYVQQEEFDQIINNNSLVIVDYTATWCGPCRAIAPIIDRLAAEYQGNATVIKVDIDNNPDNAKKYGVRSIPMIAFFKEGELVETMVGKASYEAFSNMVEQLL